MVRVPDTRNIGTAAPPRDPGVQATGADFGAAVPAAVEGLAGGGFQVAQQFDRAQERIRSRQDAVERARALGSFSETGNAELRRIETEEDFSSPETLQKFGQFLEQQEQQLLSNHSGSEESQARLAASLATARAEFATMGGSMSAKMQRQLVRRTLSDQLNGVSATATADPGTINELIAQWDERIDDMAPGLAPEEEEAFRQAGREQIALSAIQSVVDRQAYGEAEKILATPGMQQMLSPEAHRRIRSQITRAKIADEKERTAGLRKVQETEQILGRKLTVEERTRLAGVAPPAGRQSLSEKIVETETALGRPLTTEEQNKLAGLAASEGGSFGTGLTGRTLEIMTDNAPAFAAGLLTPDQDRQFMAAVTQFTQPTTFQNPDTGLLETRRPELPPFVQEALERRGVQQQAQATPTAGTSTAAQAQPAEPPPAAEPSGPMEGDDTIFNLAGLATGPVPAAAETLSRTPGIGQIVRAPQITRARNFIPLVQRDLVRVLQNNPRYAEGERKAIEAEIDIRPQVFDDPNAFKDRLVAIDDALAIRLKNALSTAQSAKVGRDERVQSMNVANAIVQFRENLGVPPRVKTVEEAKALGPGALFIDPQGIVRRVPAGVE